MRILATSDADTAGPESGQLLSERKTSTSDPRFHGGGGAGGGHGERAGGPRVSHLPEKYAPLLERFRDGKRIGLARAITVVENEQSGFETFLHEVLSAAGPQGARVGRADEPRASGEDRHPRAPLRVDGRDVVDVHLKSDSHGSPIHDRMVHRPAMA